MSVNKGTPLTKDEVALLLRFIKDHEAIVSKATNATNNLLKEEAWLKLTNSFNASIASCPRRVEQLKLKWENLKKAARKRSQKIRMNVVQTGGGKPFYIPPDDILDTVAEILGPTCEGYTVPFGGDSHETAVERSTESEIQIEILESDIVCAGPSNEDNIVSVNHPIPHKVATTPKSVQETPTIKKFFFNSAKSNHVKQKRKLIEDDIIARTMRNKAIAGYYIKKEKREEIDMENKRLENEKLALEIEKTRLENEKLKREMENNK